MIAVGMRDGFAEQLLAEEYTHATGFGVVGAAGVGDDGAIAVGDRRYGLLRFGWTAALAILIAFASSPVWRSTALAVRDHCFSRPFA